MLHRTVYPSPFDSCSLPKSSHLCHSRAADDRAGRGHSRTAWRYVHGRGGRENDEREGFAPRHWSSGLWLI